MDDLDRRLAALGWTSDKPNLSGLEAAVWAEIDARSRPTLAPMSTSLAIGLCASVAVLASSLGVATAAAAATSQCSPIAAFTIVAPLAPSTALGR